MMKRYKEWLRNAPIKKKFIPPLIITSLCILIIGGFSINSVLTVNNLSQRVFTENAPNTEMLTEITETMYVCRVLGRDILLQQDAALRQELYTCYIASFEKLDLQMDDFSQRLTGEKRDLFCNIIASKDIYRESMILSADLKNKGNNGVEALDALTSVTPIADKFFGSIDQFLTDEKQLMSDVLNRNDTLVILVLAVVIIMNILVAFLLFATINSFSSTMSNSLISLEKSVTEIANSGNMRINIPDHLFTKDEIGLIAIATSKLKTMLRNFSFRDSMTGGYNVTAYYEELADIFDQQHESDSQIEFHCLIFDMNNLKQINDEYGHIEGDKAIIDAHSILNECFSEYGKTFRVGGDEFIAVLYDCSRDEIDSKIEKMLAMVEERNETTKYKFSIAWGCGEFKGTEKKEFEEHYIIVDMRMYQNKESLKKSKD